MTKFTVTAAAQRPARTDGRCFYCSQPIGADHKEDCVLIYKKVRIRMTIEYDIDVPAYWDAEKVEFARNQGSWCADNALDELANLDGCLCGKARFEFVEEKGEPFLSER